MADKTGIEWTDATWNVITGCSVVSPGCTNCYAMRLAGSRLMHHPSRAGLTRDTKAGPVWTGEVRFNEQWLLQPLRWRKPRRIFVCAHGDLFHPSVPDAWRDRVFAVMALARWHTFQVLTKRTAQMAEYFGAGQGRGGALDFSDAERRIEIAADAIGGVRSVGIGVLPLPNVWLGTSAEDQPRADERLFDLIRTPAAVHFLSAEPLLGPMDIRPFLGRPGGVIYDAAGSPEDFIDPERGLDLVIVGGESGPGARGMDTEWARSLRDQCSGHAFFFMKQMARKAPIPDDLMVREWPR
ncbi:MAG TPA: phage Gp37/Gp68 family protein [Rhodocyclaceae bacterium]|nr:phage Gp37/Gp68 family protein [Rhodocyclaceae bacterium]